MLLANFGYSFESCRASTGCETPGGGVIVLGCSGAVDCRSISTPDGNSVECDGIVWRCPKVVQQ
tara:strand:- start:2463 stop:2654 length:192 start_codon:yes stop_codon:yes gene_type:complete